MLPIKMKPLFKHPLSPDILYNRWLSWSLMIAPALLLALGLAAITRHVRCLRWMCVVSVCGLCVLGTVEIMHSLSPEEAIASHCQMAAGKCYPQP